MFGKILYRDAIFAVFVSVFGVSGKGCHFSQFWPFSDKKCPILPNVLSQICRN